MHIDDNLQPEHFPEKLDHFWALSGEKILGIENEYDLNNGTPVFTVNGKYASRG